jgi:hypothetical protein
MNVFVSAGTGAAVTMVGLPWVERIKSKNQRKLVELDHKRQQIDFWKRMIPEREKSYFEAAPDITRFRQDPNVLNLIPYMDHSFQQRLDDLILPGEFIDGVTDEEVIRQQKMFRNILIEMSAQVSKLEHSWFFNIK